MFSKGVRTEKGEGLRLRKGRKGDDDLEVATGSSGALQWKCPACGAFNDDSEQKCTECTAIRADAPAVPKTPEKITTADWEAALAEPDEPEELDTDKDEAEAEEPEEPEEETSAEPPGEPPVITGPLSSISTSSPSTPTTTSTPSSFSTPSTFSAPSTYSPPSTPTTGGTHYYLTFVNSPASSIIKSKVSIDFDDFDVVSIGRNPENVIVVPDPEVSRKHAQLTIQGSRLMLKDLGSKNGTYVYNGKQFEQVSDSVEVKPNSLIKFGTGTIVRLTSE